MAANRTLPVKARAFIAAVSVSGGAIALVAAAHVPGWTRTDAKAFGVLVLMITLMELFPIPVGYRTETLNMSMTDAVWAAALLLVRPSVLTMAVALGATLGQAVRRRPAYKAAFNVGQYLLGIAAAEAVFAVFGSPAMGAGSAFLAVVVAMAAFFVVNATSVAVVISLMEGESALAILRAPLVPNLVHWACNTSTGLLAAVVWTSNREALALLVAPLVLSYFAYRAWVAGVRERDQMRNLYEAGRSLFAPIEAAADFGPFLALVQRMLGATSVELLEVEDDHLAIHHSAGSVTRTPVGEGTEMRSSLESYLGTKHDVSSHVKVIGGAHEVRGVLVVYRKESITGREQSLLDALASQIYVMLENHRLFFETLEQAQLVDVIADTSDGIFVVSPEQRVLSWNPAMERITGLPADEAVGRGTAELLEIQTVEDRDERVGPLGEAGDALVLGKDADRHWIRYTRNVIRDRDGGLKAYVVVAHDVTAELEAEQIKRDFVATVSHELRTPLTPLKGFLTTLLRGTGDDSAEERHEYYRIMLNQANRLERLITDLLEVSRIESGKPLVDGRAFELSSVVTEQVRDFSQQHPEREIRFKAPSSPAIVCADAFRVGQVVANLVSNALKYSAPEAPVEVAITWGGEHAIVSVRDQGEGIPATEQHRVFERFHRLENGLTRRTGGTGLGLYIAKRLVEAMDGRIWLHSKPGAGSTFSFSLPAARAEESWPVAPVLRLDLEAEVAHAERRPA